MNHFATSFILAVRQSLTSRRAQSVVKWMRAIAAAMVILSVGSSTTSAGTVVIDVVGDVYKTVYITGDNADNILNIYNDTNGFLYVDTWLGTGTVIEGDRQIPMFSGRVVINMGSGNDSIRIEAGAYLEDTDFQVSLGGGDDSVFVKSAGAALKNLDIDTGDGDDSVGVELVASGSVSVATVSGKDWVQIAASSVAGDLLVSTGKQNDSLTVQPGVSVGGLLGLVGGAGGRDALFLPAVPQDLSYGGIFVDGFETTEP